MSMSVTQRGFRLPFLQLRTLIAHWRRVARTRRALARLDYHALRDIGLTEIERDKEVARPFWR